MSKYHAQPAFVDGIRFQSKAEARHYQTLTLLQRSGAIENLKLQPRFVLHVMGVKICTYVADFSYTDRTTGMEIVCDVKGVKTPIYRLKKRLMKAVYGIEVQEVQA